MAEGQRGRPKKQSIDDDLMDNNEIFQGENYQSSPIEEKIQNLVEENRLGCPPHPWSDIETSARNGMPIYISETGEDEGVLSYWKKTRTFSNPIKRWVEQGKWVDFMSGQDIKFHPNFWRERYGIV